MTITIKVLRKALHWVLIKFPCRNSFGSFPYSSRAFLQNDAVLMKLEIVSPEWLQPPRLILTGMHDPRHKDQELWMNDQASNGSEYLSVVIEIAPIWDLKRKEQPIRKLSFWQTFEISLETLAFWTCTRATVGCYGVWHIPPQLVNAFPNRGVRWGAQL